MLSILNIRRNNSRSFWSRQWESLLPFWLCARKNIFLFFCSALFQQPFNLKEKHWYTTIFSDVKGQPKISHFANKIYQKSTKYIKNQKSWETNIFVLCGHTLPCQWKQFVLSSGNSSRLLYPKYGNSLTSNCWETVCSYFFFTGRKQTIFGNSYFVFAFLIS